MQTKNIVFAAAHTKFWDDNQRVYIPLVSTVATDQKTNSHVTYAEDNVWVTDRIYYSHLQKNTEYRLVSLLWDKETEEIVVDDKGRGRELAGKRAVAISQQEKQLISAEFF